MTRAREKIDASHLGAGGSAAGLAHGGAQLRTSSGAREREREAPRLPTAVRRRGVGGPRKHAFRESDAPMPPRPA